MSDNPEINVQRRRKGDRPTEQAKAPQRRQPSGNGLGGGFGGTGGGSPFGGGGLFTPTRGKVGGCGSLLVILLIIVLYMVFSGGGNDGGANLPTDQIPPTETARAQVLATNTPRLTRVPSLTGSGNTWLVMLYQDADDQVLEQDIFLDFNEAERVGSSDKVTIISQLDRFRGGFATSPDWSTTRRYLITQDDNLNVINSQLLDDIGETNMADGQTLVDFVTWAVKNYPAHRYALILSDHGMGWPGGWSDPTGGQDPGYAPLINAIQGDNIYLAEMDSALGQIQAQTGIERLDLIGMDACLMSQMEVYAMLQPYARYAVASEETEPGLGWAYAAFLDDLVKNPSMDGAQLATNIVDSYIGQDQRIVDNEARADFLRQGSTMGGFFSAPSVSAAQIANQIERDVTLTALDLNDYADLVAALNDFAYKLQSVDQRAVASARNYTQSYTSIFGREVPPSYIDMGHFAQLVVKQSGDADLAASAQALVDAENRAIIAERHGSAKPGSTGVAVYFPNSSLYRSPYSGMQSYTLLAERFSRVSLWDDFLVYHYNDRTFKADAAELVVPPAGGVTRAPGAGPISINWVGGQNSSVSPGKSIKLTVDISGKNIGYIYLFAGLYDQASKSIYVADTDDLESADAQNVNGVYYPVWPDSEFFRMNFDWEPILFQITDGSQKVLTLFTPVTYGASSADAAYLVQGSYTFADTGEQRTAQLIFKGGKLFQVVGYTGSEAATAPREITPNEGDTFTVANKWLEDGGKKVVFEDGETLTFGAEPFQWQQVYAPAGEYVVGFLVTDLDGNVYTANTQVTVR